MRTDLHPRRACLECPPTLPVPLPWLRRNEDKPNRCPACHLIAFRMLNDTDAGPRTVLRCPHGCGRWRYGRRYHREPMRYRPAVRVTYRGRCGLLPVIITPWQGGRRA